MVLENPKRIGTRDHVWVLAGDDIDTFFKAGFDSSLPEDQRRVKDNQVSWLQKLQANDSLEKRFNRIFFTAGDSREPELAGIFGAIMGSVYALLITLALSFPIGIAAGCLFGGVCAQE